MIINRILPQFLLSFNTHTQESLRAEGLKSKRAKELLVTPLLVALLLLTNLGSVLAASVPQISAPSAILIDAKTGRVLMEKNSRVERPIASTTKMMTAILVIENCGLDEVAVTTPKAAATGEAEIYLKPGEMMTVENLLFGTLLKSGNDSAAALAEHTAGSVNDFIVMMNDKAKKIGALNTTFKNPTGLEEAGHKSTAHDLGIIARYALQNETFAKMVATRSYVIPWPGNTFPRTLKNHNKLLLKYDYVTGVKTGYTKEAGHCLVSSAAKGEKELIVVVLGSISSEDCYLDSESILNYGFANFHLRTVLTKNEEFKAIPIWGKSFNDLIMQPSDEVVMLMADGEKIDFKKSIMLSYPNRPIKKGEKVGKLILANDKGDLVSIDLIAKRDVDKKIFWIMRDGFSLMLAKLRLLFERVSS